MKRLFLFTLCSLIFVINGYSQSDQVSFIHGLNDNASVWNYMANQLSDEFDFAKEDVNYNSEAAVSNSASNASISSGTVAIGHSLGGLMAREYLRQNGTGSMNALITVGTPHKGAPVAESVQNGEVADMIYTWISDLAAGPAISLGSLVARDFARAVLSEFNYSGNAEGTPIDIALENMFGNVASVDNMKPNSSFLSTLNNSPNNTLPSARYTIFGVEDNYEYVRIAESFRNKSNGDNPRESEVFLRYHHAATSFYFVATAYYSYLASEYFYKYSQSDPSDPLYTSYYDKAVFFLSIAREWARGFASLADHQQRDWDQKIIGVNYYTDNGEIVAKDANDGLLNARTQAPSFFNASDNIERRLRADGANHLEETTHPSVKERLSEVFQNSDVNIPEAGTGDQPLSVSISGVPYVNDGQSATFSANVSDAEGPVSYQWYFRQESYVSWTAVGTGSTYSRTFYSAPGGETAHSAVKVEVTSAGETASDIHSVDVYGCQSSGLQAQSADANIIIPCD
jgi:hypothetical protein